MSSAYQFFKKFCSCFSAVSSHHVYPSYHHAGMNPYMSCGVNPVTSTDALYSYTPNVKLEYPGTNICNQYGGNLPTSIPASTNGIYSSIQSTVPTTSSAKQVRHVSHQHTHACDMHAMRTIWHCLRL